MRIALLSWESLHSIAVGGVGAHVTELAASLVRKGHQVHVFTRRTPNQRGHDLIDGVHYHRCLYSIQSNFIDDVNSMCRAFVDRVFEVEDFVGHFDIIHAHDWLVANAMIWIKKGREHQCVLTIHSTEYARCGNAFGNGESVRIRDQERAGTYWADRVIAVSEATKKEIMWMYEVPDWKTSVIYNGVSPQRFGQITDPGEDKHRYGIAPLDPTVLFCGRLAWQKAPDLLVEAIPSVVKAYGNAKFLFAGDGEMRGALESRVRQLGIQDTVKLLGYRNGDELVRLFKLADVICVPSRNEPFGIVVLEAWSANKPVIATQNGGPDEYVWHEVNGLKIYPNPNSVTWGICRIFSDFDWARWMGSNGRKAVEERFTWDTIAEQTLVLYDEVCLSPAVQPEILPDTVQTNMQKPPSDVSSTEKSYADIVEIRDQDKDRDASIAIQAKLCIEASNLDLAASDALDVFRSSLARAGLDPQSHDHTLAIKGDWNTVLAALRSCYQRVQRTNEQQRRQTLSEIKNHTSDIPDQPKDLVLAGSPGGSDDHW